VFASNYVTEIYELQFISGFVEEINNATAVPNGFLENLRAYCVKGVSSKL
jgi:hypothetical protein